MEYLLLKGLHIVSSTILFGTGIGSAFYKYIADRGKDVHHIAHINRHVVLADWLFTTPSIILQPLTGIAMVYMAGYSLLDSWLLISIALYLLAGACWLPVVVLQIRMRDIAQQAAQESAPLPPLYNKYAQIWFWLGIPAFISLVFVFFLMTLKPV